MLWREVSFLFSDDIMREIERQSGIVFDGQKQDESKEWKIINEILGHKKINKVLSTITDVNNRLVSENTEICNILHNYFTNVGPSMDAKIPTTQLKKFNTTSIMKLFCYDPIRSEEVLI